MTNTFKVCYLFLVTGFFSLIPDFGTLYAQAYSGFFNFEYEENSGKMLLEVSVFDEDFLFVTALGTGVGSNDIGLDRGKLGNNRVVRFEKQGDRILLIERNLAFRAVSDSFSEKQAVEEAFAFSVLYGFKIEKSVNQKYYIDLTPFLLEDHHNVAQLLKEQKQGTFKADKTKSALYFQNILAFPDNCEWESILTLTGEATGSHIKSVVPTPESVSFRQHFSFIRLPDNEYTPRKFHPNSGYFYTGYYDYATPINQPLEKRYITRHRLKKQDPGRVKSKPVKPIIYYIDRGCPEPVKSALIDGARWWNQAFEAAGFIDAFEVRELPEDAHPLDVRYNMIQWVHRSTRGWSYGASVTDPRTGEILKGHVSLGSLRVRQDYLIAQGILSPFVENADDDPRMIEMALARLRQLSAHEVGHTIGLAHNFAASMNGRASVMDYPHPYITLDDSGNFDFSRAYDNKIGIWDERAIIYGYSEFTPDKEEDKELAEILNITTSMGLYYLSDEDARGTGSASPIAHLWDNGISVHDEFDRISQVRSKAISRFGLNSIPAGTPVSELEKVFVPVYFMHRYQAEALSKLIGGIYYNYDVKGFTGAAPIRPVEAANQKKALEQLLQFVSDTHLGIPDQILQHLPPPAFGYPRTRESFKSYKGLAFDEYAAMESAAAQIAELLMHPERLNRIKEQKHFGLDEYIYMILNHHNLRRDYQNSKAIFQKMIVGKISELISNDKSNADLSARLMYLLDNFKQGLVTSILSVKDPRLLAHYKYLIHLSTALEKSKDPVKLPAPAFMPPGAPIGCCSMDHFQNGFEE